MRGQVAGAALIVMAALMSSAAYSENRTIQDLYTDCKTDGALAISCMRYLSGVATMMQAIGAMILDPKTPPDKKLALYPFGMCNLDAVSNLQMKQIFVNWAEKNPELWQREEGIGAWAAIHETWPCVASHR